MLDAAHAISSFIKNTERQTLDNNLMLTSALIRQLEIFGEAATAITKEFREAHPSIPWKKIIGMRNRLIHAYFDVNLDILWFAVSVEIPKTIPELEKMNLSH